MADVLDTGFQDTLESLARDDMCGDPFPLDRRPYGALAIELTRHTNPLLLGVHIMANAVTYADMFEEDVEAILETTQYLTNESGTWAYWPEVRYVHAHMR
ncbi:hypothetical protein [Paraburkholderia youngii]|uniref:hypothetical protein n=1 Tax=Paraburkholderia youngii TaxID=2782701 RepID=UPI0015909E8F|nr:hypothetical protein [Paraburkholderia youngii]NUX58697.1 hypothetical protein [Paraburkholderia youngii]